MATRVNRVTRCLACGLTLVAIPLLAGSGADDDDEARDPRYGLLTPLPDRGGVPPIVEHLAGPTDGELAARAKAREYTRQIRIIRRDHFGRIRVPEIREEGIRRLGEFVDPASFRPLIEELAREQDDVRMAVLDHLAGQDEMGQAALAWAAIHDPAPAWRAEATRRVTPPASKPVLRVLDAALRSRKHEIANHAGTLAGTIGAIKTIPLLMFAQATRDPAPQDEGDLAWIAIETQHAYVANLQPIVGSNAGAFQPIMGVVHEGTVLRVTDAVVVVYRTEVHRALVSLTTEDFGQSTEHLGYDMYAWWEWYNSEYVPFKNEQAKRGS